MKLAKKIDNSDRLINFIYHNDPIYGSVRTVRIGFESLWPQPPPADAASPKSNRKGVLLSDTEDR